jgi:branched-chain amino acid transport system substrate-binding protein
MMSRSLAAVRLAVALLLSGLLLLAACSGGGPRQREGDAGTARVLYDSFEQEYLLHRDAQALTLGGRLLDEYPDYPLADAVAAKMVTAAVRLPDLDRAQELAMAFPERFPGSIHRDAAMKTAARGLADAGRPADGLRVLARLAAVQQGAARRSTEELALALAEPLDAALLNELVAEPGMRSLAPALRGLAAIEEEEAPAVVAGRIGVLTPLTGRYARFGNAFQAGVRQGLRSEDPQGSGPWEIVLEDTEGDPVPAALAARRLCRDEGCQLLIGALLSATTATAALVAQEHGVPLVSPTATNERLGELGASILQTNLTGPVEVEILARLATEVLLKQRFAIIRPDTPEGLNLATAFADKVTELGGEIVIESVFDPAATDFRSQVLALRETRPEVVFAPTTVDQMVLLGPQLDFYRVGALVLGPSEWNSSRLMERAGSVMERTVFPVSEVVYPPEWSAEFRADWPTAQYDEESTRLARSAYLATRLALRVMKEMPEATPQEITAALHARLSGRGADVAEPDGYAALVNLVEDGQPRSFPGHLYREAWLRQLEADSLARADSLALADSLGLARPDSAATRPDSTATAPPPLNPPRR